MYRMKAAIIGTGQMGRAHLQGLRRIGVEVHGVLGSSLEKGERFAVENGIPHTYHGLEDLMADAQVQVVHICTPNRSHYPQARAALESGKHVVAEKPLALTSVESRQLLELAQKTGLAAVLNHNFRFFPMTLEAHALAREGTLGSIRLIQGGYCQDWLFPPERWDWRLLPEYGGVTRVISDIGSHWLDMISWITGLEVTEVSASSALFTPERINPATGQPVKIENEDAAVLIARYSNGALASATWSQSSPGRDNHFWFELTGSLRSLQWDQEELNSLHIGRREGERSLWEVYPGPLHHDVQQVISLPDGQVRDYLDTFPALYRLVYSALEAGKLPDPGIVPTFKDGQREMVLIEAILEASKSAAWVKINKDW